MRNVPQHNKSNKSYLNTNKGVTTKSLVESYLSFGALPQDFVTMISLRDKSIGNMKTKTPITQKVEDREKTKEYYEFDKNIKGTNITTKVKIYKIKNLTENCSFEEFNRF